MSKRISLPQLELVFLVITAAVAGWFMGYNDYPEFSTLLKMTKGEPVCACAAPPNWKFERAKS